MQIIALLGCARSGSTLLEGKLQEQFKICSLGEVTYLWGRGYRRDELCGCGRRFSQCSFWSEVLREGFGTVTPADAERYDLAFTRARGHLSDQLGHSAPSRSRDPVFDQVATAVYEAAYKVCGHQILVDSSKAPPFSSALLDAKIGTIGLVHVFRDARGNVQSLLTPKPRPQANGSGKLRMARSRTVLHAIGRWKLQNRQAQQLLPRASGPSLTLSYEGFCSNPEAQLSRIRSAFALPAAEAQADGWHSVSGNPIRFQAGGLDVRVDERWRSQMSERDQAIVRWLTAKQQRELEAAAGIRSRSRPRVESSELLSGA